MQFKHRMPVPIWRIKNSSSRTVAPAETEIDIVIDMIESPILISVCLFVQGVPFPNEAFVKFGFDYFIIVCRDKRKSSRITGCLHPPSESSQLRWSCFVVSAVNDSSKHFQNRTL
jgi:hypothetical protein